MRDFNQTKIFIDQLEMMNLIDKHDEASLEGHPTPEDVFETLLLRGGSDVKLSEAYARFRSIPFVHLYEISPEVKGLMDENLMRKFGFVPFYIDHRSKILQIAMTDPRKIINLNEGHLKKLSKKIGFKIEIIMAAKSQVEKALERKEDVEPETIKVSEKKQEDEPKVAVTNVKTYTNPVNIDLLKELANQGEPSSFTLAVLKYAYDKKAEEILIEPFEKKITIRFKIDGMNHNIIAAPSLLQEGILLQIRSISESNANDDLAISRQTVSLNLGSTSATELAVSIVPTIFGERIHLRFLHDSRTLPTLESLGMFEKNRLIIEEVLASGFGLVLVAGLSSSGKTTTLYSMANHLAKKSLDIVTIEDKATYRFSEVSQVEIKPEVGFDYAQALRSVFSQSPDAVMVDTLSDSESAKLALEGSLTGKLILCGLYTKSSVLALHQFAALSQEQYLLSSSLKLIIAQTLVRKICSNCRVEIRVSKATEDRVKDELGTKQDLKFYKGSGCEKCKNGFRGRIPIFEILKPSDELLSSLSSGESIEQLSQMAKRSGMISMRQDGLLKVVSGLTTIDEVIKATKTEG